MIQCMVKVYSILPMVDIFMVIFQMEELMEQQSYDFQIIIFILEIENMASKMENV